MSSPNRSIRRLARESSGGSFVVIAVVTAWTAIEGCKSHPSGSEPDAAESPQAKAVPAPVASASAVASAGALPLRVLDGGPPPVPLRGDVGLEADVSVRDQSGYALTAIFRHTDTPAPIRAPELAAVAVENLRRKLESRIDVELTPTRIRIALASPAFIPSEGTELRARLDRYGHVVLLPGSSHYRVLPPGALRSFFQEGRLDAAPLSLVEVSDQVEGPGDAGAPAEGTRRLGYRVRRTTVTTRAGSITLEIARVPDLGDGGLLLCRMLLEIAAAPAETPVCGAEDLPLHASYQWKPKGAFSFEVTSLLKRPDIAAAHLAVPPAQSTFDIGPLPLPRSSHVAADTDLRELRTTPIDVPSSGTEAPGLTLVNTADVHRFVFVDHVPIAWLAPGARENIRGFQRGRYQLQWRTFLGDETDAVVTTTVPGRVPQDAGP